MLFFSHHPHYFSTHVNREVKEVYWATAIATFALSLVFIFEPIYLYTLGYSLVEILWFYFFVYCWYSGLVCFSAKITSRIGYKHSIFISNIFYVLYWITLFFVGTYDLLFFVAPLFFALQKCFFWPAYNADIALGSAKQQTGREVGALFSEIELISVIAPLIGGAISSFLGFGALFGLASILILGSVIPLFRSPDIYNRHKFTFKNFAKVIKNHAWNFFGYWGYAEDLMIMSIWPIFIFIAVGQFFGVGALSTVTSLVATALMLYVGSLTDKMAKRPLIQIASIYYGLTWVFRFLAETVASVFVFDALHKFGKATVNVSMVSLTYEIAAKKGVDQAFAYSVFYEFSLAIGKIVTALAAIAILVYFGNIHYVFILAGLMTMLYGLLRK